MTNLEYISEGQVRDLVEEQSAIAGGQGLEHIKNPPGFSNHLVNVGNIAYETAEAIRGRVPTTRGKINSGVVRTAGYMHDFGKIWIGDPYHEIETAYDILTKGGDFGLVRGGTPTERESQLVRIASCIPSDFALKEELGDNFPETAMYPDFVTPELEVQLRYLGHRLSTTPAKPRTVQELTTPDTYEKMILLYADMVDNDGKMSVEKRLDEIAERYGGEYAETAKSEAEAKYYRKASELTRQITPRITQICSEVEQLAGK